MIKEIFTVIFLIAFSVITSFAQGRVNPDSLFFEAQQKAWKGNYKTSRQLLNQVLSETPDYTDAIILYGRTFAWQEKFDSARLVLEPLYRKEPSNVGVLSVLADVELWAGNPEKTLQYVEKGLQLEENILPLLLVKARALQQMHSYKEATLVLNYILELKPDHTEALTLLEIVIDQSAANLIRVDYQVATFNKGFEAWQLGALEYTRINSNLKYQARLSFADRYDQESFQFEIDAYPRLSEKAYLYLNTGFSDGKLFPEYRVGAEIFYMLPAKFEASIGTRVLSFSEDRVIVYTGQIGKYFKKHWISFRPFLQHKEGDWQPTGVLLVRQYFGHSENQVTLILARGSTPLTQVGFEEIGRLTSSRIGLEPQFRVGKNFLAGGMLSFEYEKYLPGSSRNRLTFGLSLQRKF
jgi:YaiO family outer membrane protein